ncbi:MAG: hypothetical protein Q9226_005828, partial [Calogaya cf. arnoldii]
MSTQNSVGLLGLPYTIREGILSYLLPDQHSILHEAYSEAWMEKIYGFYGVSFDFETPALRPSWLTFDYESSSPYPEVLLANRQLYADGLHYLYERRTFSAIKEFILVIDAAYLNGNGGGLRTKLLNLLRCFRDRKAHFKKLSIQFPEPEEPLDGWDEPELAGWADAWDSEDLATWHEKEVRNCEDGYCGLGLAQSAGAKSIFAWVLSVFAVCPAIADECVITPPQPLEDRPHIRSCCEWYAARIDGRAPVLPEEELWLERDLHYVTHDQFTGKRMGCDCYICEERAKDEWKSNLSNVLEKVHSDLWRIG